MSKTVESKPVKTTHFMRNIGVEGVLLLGAFLIGFVPTWLKLRDAVSRLSQAERHLNQASVQNAMASAAIDAP